ncbi:Hypothetical predicted protein [Mytilus galloprovincialis]|uniref:Fucolectin tachylectin-4 pentraxin-1 domain-containing protein n=1 Tax=Mytilus galloprovincialis TaxID=29158 RepID=A0A8B6ELY4_MYTGA|nr:Hypothetical predicted protein [Mytilus galloprovincialis]
MLLVWLINTTVQLLVTAQINLTPFGTATQSSLYEGNAGDPQNAILPPISNDFSLDTCSHTAIGSDPSADWWMFQFSFGFAYITDITIYYRERTAIRMDGFKLYVTNTSAVPPDGYLCYEDPDPGLPNLTQIIPCSEVGKYVIYYDTKGLGNEGPVVELCYIAINGCPKGVWGTNCSETCSSICIDQHCHPENGSCIWGCHPHTYLNESCDTDTGACTEGCVIGWQYCTCSKYNLTPFGTASQSSRFIRSTPDGAILPPISNRFTLETCSTTNVDGAPKAWWMFQFSFLSAFITDITIYYREDSAYRMDGFRLCDHTSTIPPDGYLCYEDPDPGLPNITQNIPCNQLGKYVIYYDTKGDVLTNTGPVVELCYVAINGCQKGMWGPNCTEACSSICVNQHCHPENGSCIWGCDPQRCVNRRCDNHTGACTEGCVTGWVGQYCTCGKYCLRIIINVKFHGDTKSSACLVSSGIFYF